MENRYWTDSMKLKPGLRLQMQDIDPHGNAGCGSGGRRNWRIINANGKVVAKGITCMCGRGCCNTDCICDDWGYHDTDIEEFRSTSM